MTQFTTRLKLIVAAAALAASFGPLPAVAQDADTPAVAAALDKASWVKTVASSNMFEIESSKLALEKASSDEVKAFAQQMIDDHTKAGEKLAGVLEKSGDPLPPRELAPKHAEVLEQLKTADGKAFDTAYVGAQHDAHVEAVALFTAYAAKPDDPALGAFATETLPTLKMHLEHVKTMVAK